MKIGSYDFIVRKQIQWAENENIEIVGSAIDRGRRAYTTKINENLFQTLSNKTVEEFMKGDGGELKSTNDKPVRMQALHSSSALGVNIFDYWSDKKDISIITGACRLSKKGQMLNGSIKFEQKYPIDKRFTRSPNLDIVIESENHTYKAFAIESKFTEPYSSRGEMGLDPKYLDIEGLWNKMTGTKQLAENLSPVDNHFEYLHAAQLIKHILGLTNKYGRTGFRLLYLWYNAYGEAGFKHRKELDEFSNIVNSDGIKFHDMTYQELILRLSEYRKGHPEYIKYLTSRYL